MRTNLGHIYAIGDVAGLLQLARVAEAQAKVTAETIGGAGALPLGDDRMLPRAMFRQLQVVASVTEELVRTAAAKNEIVGAAVVLGAMTTAASVPGPASCANCDPHEVGF
jgi:dihydrolipoamide dehydrogenase